MIDKIVGSVEAAVADIRDGATIMIGGFGSAGMPAELIDALIAKRARNLTIVNNNAGNGDTGLAALLKTKGVRKIICSFPRQSDSYVFDGLYLHYGGPDAMWDLWDDFHHEVKTQSDEAEAHDAAMRARRAKGMTRASSSGWSLAYASSSSLRHNARCPHSRVTSRKSYPCCHRTRP